VYGQGTGCCSARTTGYHANERRLFVTRSKPCRVSRHWAEEHDPTHIFAQGQPFSWRLVVMCGPTSHIEDGKSVRGSNAATLSRYYRPNGHKATPFGLDLLLSERLASTERGSKPLTLHAACCRPAIFHLTVHLSLYLCDNVRELKCHTTKMHIGGQRVARSSDSDYWTAGIKSRLTAVRLHHAPGELR